MVSLLLDKLEPVKEFDLQKAEYHNIEAVALAYIFATIAILFLYDSEPSVDSKSFDVRKDFQMREWLNIMQNHLKAVQVDTFGW